VTHLNQDPDLLRRLLRAKDRMDAASHEEWPVERLARVLVVDDCRAAYDRMLAKGVEFTQEPVDRYGAVDAGFRDPSGNGWKLIEALR
jgi:uncharacterized glyoxalase superfamily protein PhnB